MGFEVKQTLTWEDWKAWNTSFLLNDPLVSGALRSGDSIRRFCGVSFMLIGLAALGVFLRESGPVWGVLLALAIIAAGLLVFQPGSLRRRLSRRRDRILEELPDQPVRAVFGAEGIRAWTGGRERTWPYREVRRVWEDRERFYLLPRDGHSPLLILRKSGFVQGTPEAFRAFLLEKTGRTVEWIR